MFRPLHIHIRPKTRLRAGLSWAVLILLFASLSMRPSAAQTADTLDKNATIHVTVAGEPDVSGDFTVDTNGDITMLYINQVHVAGLTVAQSQTKIQKGLAKYIRNPQVIVKLVSAGGISVEISGAVTTQGTRIVRSDTHLNDVLQQAGLTLDASLNDVKITHGAPNEAHTVTTVNYLSFLNDKNSDGNPQLADNDVIYVAHKDIPIQINIRGQVAKPGRTSASSKATVYDALQAAGGLTTGANKKGIFVQHANSDEKIAFDYDAASQQPADSTLNPILLDGDTVIVNALPAPAVYTITGAVLRPAEYPLDHRITIADAIGIAGGAIDGAHLNQMTIVRTDPSTSRTEVIKIDASNPTVQGSTFVQPGDNITIPAGSPPHHYDPLTILSIVATVVGIFAVFRRH